MGIFSKIKDAIFGHKPADPASRPQIPAGMAGGLAMGVGLGPGTRGRLVAAAAGGLLGATLGAVAYELVGALAFSLDKTHLPISAAATTRALACVLAAGPASLGAATGNSQRLNPSMRDQLIGLLQEQLHRCWVVPVALQSAPKPPVPSIRIRLNQDGSLAAEPAVMNRSAEPLFDVAAESATRAARRCSPLRIPAQFAPYYQDWKDLVVNFNLRDMG